MRSCFAAALAAALCLPAGTGGATQEPAGLLIVNAHIVQVGSGEILLDATLLAIDGSIAGVAAGTAEGELLAAQAPVETVILDAGGRYLLPGLIDAHVHISDFDAARRALRSGVTTARSMGTSHFADVGLRELAAAGVVESPQIVAAGYHVRPHPAQAFFLDFPELAGMLQSQVRGADALRTMTQALLSRTVDFVKVNATERAGLPETDPRKPFYEQEELHVLVETAGSAGVPVAAHAHGDTGGQAAVLAGVRSIEHGTYLSEETLRLMAERGTYLVPTIAVVADLTIPGGDYDNAVLNIRGRHMLPRIRHTASMAHVLGVPIVAATDTGYGPNSVLRLAHELIELQDVGLSPLEALQAATVVAAELLQVDDTTGRIAAGLDADLILVESNPLSDVAVLQDILLVVTDGRVILNRLDY